MKPWISGCMRSVSGTSDICRVVSMIRTSTVVLERGILRSGGDGAMLCKREARVLGVNRQNSRRYNARRREWKENS